MDRMTFETEDSLAQFIRRFDTGDISARDWTHAAHVAMAAAYVWDYGEAAFPRIRAGIHHLNWHHGTITTDRRGYHETLTYFWTEVVRHLCDQNRSEGRLAAVNRAVATLPSGLFREYYSYDVVKCREARQVWKAPDVKPLPAEMLSAS